MPDHITLTQHTYDADTVDIVPIEPSIREGEFLRTSIINPDAAENITRFPPQLIENPFITGDPTLPALLECQVGTWSGSPQPSFAFQWMADGVDIPGFTNYRETFGIEFDSKNITCEVRAFSVIGENYGFTDPVFVTVIEPIETRSAEWNVTTGIGALSLQSIFKITTVITSGISTEGRSDVQRAVAYFLTGVAADKRQDVNTKVVNAITGLGAEDRNYIYSSSVAAVTQNVVPELEPNVIVPVPLINPNASMGLIGWTMLDENFPLRVVDDGGSGGATFVQWRGRNDVSPDEDNIPYNYMYQEVDMPSEWHSVIDTGEVNINTSWYQKTDDNKAEGNMRVDFLNALGDLIASNPGPGLLFTREGVWVRREFGSSVPVGTRAIRYYVETQWGGEGDDCDIIVDSIKTLIKRGENFNDRAKNGGPDYKQWRINGELLWTGDYMALGELEFRNSIGGADQAVGGNGPINGSFDFGGDKLYAFDDLRDQNYWASESNAVNKGTAWLGYDFGNTSFKPREISITGRLGSFGAQMAQNFTLEGSADGVTWVKVQEYENVPQFGSLEQRQFEVLDGNQGWFFDINNVTLQDLNETIREKGNHWYTRSRININKIRVYPQNLPTDYKILVYRLDSNYWIESLVHESPVLTYDNLTGGWDEYDLSASPIEIECGVHFLITFADRTNSTCKLRKMTEDNTFDQLDAKPYCEWIAAWRNYFPDLDRTPMKPGDFTGSLTNENTVQAIDFEASVF